MHLRRFAYPQRVPTHAPPRKGSVHPRRSALHSATGAAPPRKGSVHLRRSAHHSATGAAPPIRERAPMPVRPPQRDRRAPPRKGSVHLRRTTRLSVCRRAPLRKGSVRPRREALRGLAGARAQRPSCAPHAPRAAPLGPDYGWLYTERGSRRRGVCLGYPSPSPASSLGEPALISARRCVPRRSRRRPSRGGCRSAPRESRRRP